MALGPIDYSSMIQQPDFASSLAQGLQLGQAIKQRNFQQQMQQQYLQDAATAMRAGTPDSLTQLMIKYPQYQEAISKGLKAVGEAQTKNDIKLGLRVSAALENGQADVAKQVLQERVAALQNSKQPFEEYAKMIEAIDRNPEEAKSYTNFMLAHAMGPEQWGKFGEELRAQKAAPVGIRTAEAKAQIAEAEAISKQNEVGNQPTKIELENAKSREEIETAKLKRKLDIFDAQIKRANSENERAKLQLERDKIVQTLDEKQRTVQTEAQSNLETLNNASKLAEKLLTNENDLRWATGMSGLIGFIPGTKTKSVQGELEQLSNILAAANLDKLKGAMSDKDIMFLKNINANLSKYNSDDETVAEVKRVLGQLVKAQSKIASSGNLPTTGAYVGKDKKGRIITEGEINQLLMKFPASTRDQVLEFLSEKGMR